MRPSVYQFDSTTVLKKRAFWPFRPHHLRLFICGVGSSTWAVLWTAERGKIRIWTRSSQKYNRSGKAKSIVQERIRNTVWRERLQTWIFCTPTQQVATVRKQYFSIRSLVLGSLTIDELFYGETSTSDRLKTCWICSSSSVSPSSSFHWTPRGIWRSPTRSSWTRKCNRITLYHGIVSAPEC